MRRSIRCSPLWFILVPVIAAACSDNNATTPIQPTTPTTVTDTFSGSIARNGAITHAFGVQTGGQVTARLTTLDPEDAVIGLSLGTWNGSSCQIVLANDSATKSAVIVGNVTSLGNLCVRIYDAGNLIQTTSYQVEVVHP